MTWRKAILLSIALFISGFVFIGLSGDTINWQANLGTTLVLFSFITAPIIKLLPHLKTMKTQLTKGQKTDIIMVLILMGIAVPIIFWVGLYTDIADPKPQSNLAVGQSGFLRSGSVETLFVAVDQESFKELVKAARAKDTIGILELADQRRIFGVTVGTSVLILDKNFSQYRIRVLKGVQEVDTDKVGRAGWVPREWVVAQ